MSFQDYQRLADSNEALKKEFVQLKDQLSKQRQEFSDLSQAMYDLNRNKLVREDSHRLITQDTNSANEFRYDCFTLLGGVPANSLSFPSVGGGSLQVSINGEGYVPVTISTVFQNENISYFWAKTTSQAAGTATMRIGAATGAR